MALYVLNNAAELGEAAAKHGSDILRKAIAEKGKARALFSTGASQFTFFEALKKQELPWDKVTFFHLDEYIGLSEGHKASFSKYLKERFLNHVPMGEVHLIDGKGDPESTVKSISELLLKEPIDVGFIGIGENAHVAFNDPPADFETKAAFHIVTPNETCRKQQVNEGWFSSIEEVPIRAISMTVHQIMQCRTIISCVPDKRKAAAIRDTLTCEVSNNVPATILRTHADWHLYLDKESASLMP